MNYIEVQKMRKEAATSMIQPTKPMPYSSFADKLRNQWEASTGKLQQPITVNGADGINYRIRTKPAISDNVLNKDVYRTLSDINNITGGGEFRAPKATVPTWKASFKLMRNGYQNQDPALKNSIPKEHYINRPEKTNEEGIRTYLGLKPGSDKAFWRNYNAGKASTIQADRDRYNMLANAANTPGDHQVYYKKDNQEPPSNAISQFMRGMTDKTLYPFVPPLTLEDLKSKPK